MKPTEKLTVFLFNDLETWERACVEPILDHLSRFAVIETVWVTEAQRRFFKNHRQGNFWIISKNWTRALDFLSAHSHRAGKMFVSVLSGDQESKRLYRLSFNSFFSKLPETATLIVYSPMDYQFFKQIEKVPETRLRLGLMPAPNTGPFRDFKRSGKTFEVGTICDFLPESNISFLCSVAHYVGLKSSRIHFNVIGRGPLYGHFSRMVKDLELDNQVSVVETSSLSALNFLDLFVYFPLRNHHFIPILLAGAHQLPVVSFEVPGIENYITTEKTGVLVLSSSVKEMGEKILDLEANERKRRALGTQLHLHLRDTASIEFIRGNYEKLIFNQRAQEPIEIKEAV